MTLDIKTPTNNAMEIYLDLDNQMALCFCHRFFRHMYGIGNNNLLNVSSKYSKTSLNRPTIGPSLTGPFREVIGLGS